MDVTKGGWYSVIKGDEVYYTCQVLPERLVSNLTLFLTIFDVRERPDVVVAEGEGMLIFIDSLAYLTLQ